MRRAGTDGHFRQVFLTAIVSLSAILAAGTAYSAEQSGTVRTGNLPISYSKVSLYQAGTTTGGKATLLGKATANSQGAFQISYTAPAGDAVVYLVAKGGSIDKFGLKSKRGRVRFATVLGAGNAPSDIVINERTTVATAYAFAQFIDGKHISGVAPGPKNAALTLRNLVNVRNGGIGGVLGSKPNGSNTQTMGEFNSLANMLAACVRGRLTRGCKALFALAKSPGGSKAKNTLQAAVNIAHSPGKNVTDLFDLSMEANVYTPVLKDAVGTWTLALLYDGGGKQLDGPGNMVFDSEGNVWIGNNYVYKKSPHTSTCGGTTLIRLTPDGKNYPGAPYSGGGVYGVGFGIAMDEDENVWLGNFGFKGTGCKKDGFDESVSLFNSNGEAQSPDYHGYTDGNVNRVQGVATDEGNSVWFANCGNDTVTLYPGGDHTLAQNFAPAGMKKPFAAAVDSDRNVWFTSNTTNRVFKFDQDGNLLFRSARNTSGLKRPMGVAVDSLNNAWVSNSGVIAAPCYKGESLNIPNPNKASVSMFAPDGTASKLFNKTGAHIPWGIAVDGDDTVWVANFGAMRVTQICGARPENCPPGLKTGDPISPEDTGWAFDGLDRNTAVQIDSSGNVWLANNWLPIPYQTNPGGKTMAVFVGLAAPVKTPVVGPPQRP
jgi:sugar lactone lactonase YvrE